MLQLFAIYGTPVIQCALLSLLGVRGDGLFGPVCTCPSVCLSTVYIHSFKQGWWQKQQEGICTLLSAPFQLSNHI